MLAFCRQLLIATSLALAIVAPLAACSGDTQPDFDSTATVVVGDITYQLKVACYESDANLTAVGVGADEASGESIKGLVRGPEVAYVGLMFGDDEYIYEADANTPLTITRDGDRLTGEAIAFVRDIDLDTADGPAVGTGSVTVECVTTRAGVPDSPLKKATRSR